MLLNSSTAGMYTHSFGEEVDHVLQVLSVAPTGGPLGVEPIAGRAIEGELDIRAVIRRNAMERRFSRSPSVLGTPIMNGCLEIPR